MGLVFLSRVGWLSLCLGFLLMVIPAADSGFLWKVGAVTMALGCGAYLLLNAGTVVVTSKMIEHITVRGTLGINWEETARVEIHPSGSGIAFHSTSRSLAIPGPMYWSGPQAKVAAEAIPLIAKSYGVPVTMTNFAVFRRSRNARRPRA